MDLSRYLELYLSETHDHLRALGQGLLALESGGAATAAVEEAFRAAHTIKGMSATMGFKRVTEICHELEDRLDDVRAGRLEPTREVVDELLARADELERAVELSAEESRQPDAVVIPAAVPIAGTGARPTHEDGPLVVRVRLDTESPMKAARALIIVRGLTQKQAITSSEPAEFGDDFSGEFIANITPDYDLDALEGEIASSPDVIGVSIEREGAPPPTAAAAAPAAASKAAPARLIRVDQAKLDEIAGGMAELIVLQARLENMADEDGPLGRVAHRMGLLIAELRDSVLGMRMVPVGDVFDRFPRVVRDAARSVGKDIDFRIEGRDIELDRSILNEIVDPLVHLLRNAVDHGIEGPVGRMERDKPLKGQIVLRAIRERSSVRLELEDDGRGINAERVIARATQAGIQVSAKPQNITSDELLRILAHPGFSTAEQVTDLSGRGVGMDAVVSRVRALGGAIDMTTRPGQGTTFSIRLPITLAVAQALHVRIAGEDYAIPLTHVSEALRLDQFNVHRKRGREVVRVRDEMLPLVRLRGVLGSSGAGSEEAAVVAEVGERRSALAVDELVGREQILVKEFDGAVGTLPIFSGVTLLGDGRPALVLDPLSVV